MEENLTSTLRKTIDDSANKLSISEQKIIYEHLDFNPHQKKGITTLENFVDNLTKS